MKLLLNTVALFALFNVNTSGAFGASECGEVLLNKDKNNLPPNCSFLLESTLDSSATIEEEQWAWQVAIYHTVPEKRYICGGTLVSTRHVITAAHCVTTRSGSLSKNSPEVYLGKHNLKDSGEKVQVGTIKKILLHPEHNATFFKRDLAILELQDQVTFSDRVQLVWLWPESDIELKNIVGQTGTVVGWLNHPDTAGELKVLETAVVSQETCIRSKPEFFATYTSDSTYCAESRGCVTSGHGMVLQRDGSWYLRGVVSLAVAAEDPRSRCDPAHYTVYADVAQALPWIKESLLKKN